MEWIFSGFAILILIHAFLFAKGVRRETHGYALLVFIFLWIIISALGMKFTGLYRGYSEGERSGYVTKLSLKGVIFKTNEGEMQIGTGQMAALQDPFRFSVHDDQILEILESCVGSDTRVRLKYIQWLVMPWPIGSSGYEIVSVKKLQGELKR